MVNSNKTCLTNNFEVRCVVIFQETEAKNSKILHFINKFLNFQSQLIAICHFKLYENKIRFSVVIQTTKQNSLSRPKVNLTALRSTKCK